MAKYKAEIYAKVAETEGNYEVISNPGHFNSFEANMRQTQSLLNIAKRATKRELAILLENYDAFEEVNEMQRKLEYAKQELMNKLVNY